MLVSVEASRGTDWKDKNGVHKLYVLCNHPYCKRLTMILYPCNYGSRVSVLGCLSDDHATLISYYKLFPIWLTGDPQDAKVSTNYAC